MVAPHAVLKRLARMQGQSIEKYLALFRRNDPFYTGTATHHLQARWVKRLYHLAGSPVPVHVRRLHYLAASRPDVYRPDGSAYINSARDWDLMHHACKYARYLGLIPFEVFEDRRNFPPIIFSRARSGQSCPGGSMAGIHPGRACRSFGCDIGWNEAALLCGALAGEIVHFG